MKIIKKDVLKLVNALVEGADFENFVYYLIEFLKENDKSQIYPFNIMKRDINKIAIKEVFKE